MSAAAAAATIGHNNPPEPTEEERIQAAVDALMVETGKLVDGDPISTEEQAEDTQAYLRKIQRAGKEVEGARTEEKKPHLDAGKAVDAKWKPFKDRLDKASKALKSKLTPWLQEVERKKREAEQAAREAAQKAARDAEKAQRAAEASGGFADADAAEEAKKRAEQADLDARKAAKDKAAVKGAGRASSLRKTKTVVLDNERLLAAHYYTTRHEEFIEVLLGWAQAEVRAGSEAPPGTKIEIVETAQ